MTGTPFVGAHHFFQPLLSSNFPGPSVPHKNGGTVRGTSTTTTHIDQNWGKVWKHVGVAMAMGLPLCRWMVFLRENPNLKWMVTRGIPIYGNPIS